jgi:hypothetical protein
MVRFTSRAIAPRRSRSNFAENFARPLKRLRETYTHLISTDQPKEVYPERQASRRPRKKEAPSEDLKDACDNGRKSWLVNYF